MEKSYKATLDHTCGDGQLSTMQHWGFVSKTVPNGHWILHDTAEKFLRGSPVPRYKYIWNNRVQDITSSDTITVNELLDFSFEELDSWPEEIT